MRVCLFIFIYILRICTYTHTSTHAHMYTYIQRDRASRHSKSQEQARLLFFAAHQYSMAQEGQACMGVHTSHGTAGPAADPLPRFDTQGLPESHSEPGSTVLGFLWISREEWKISLPWTKQPLGLVLELCDLWFKEAPFCSPGTRGFSKTWTLKGSLFFRRVGTAFVVSTCTPTVL